VTRDVISAPVEDGGYTLMDTGGLGLKDNETSSAAIIAASERQVGFAIDTAALILFVIDGLGSVTALDDRSPSACGPARSPSSSSSTRRTSATRRPTTRA
jgi:predicted GTPase